MNWLGSSTASHSTLWMPEAITWRPLTAAECYRFVLSHPGVNVCLTAPSNAERMDENLQALQAGPLDEEEMARARRIGRHIYAK